MSSLDSHGECTGQTPLYELLACLLYDSCLHPAVSREESEPSQTESQPQASLSAGASKFMLATVYTLDICACTCTCSMPLPLEQVCGIAA